MSEKERRERHMQQDSEIFHELVRLRPTRWDAERYDDEVAKLSHRIEQLERELTEAKAQHLKNLESALAVAGKLERKTVAQNTLLDDIYAYLKRCADDEWNGDEHRPNEEARLLIRMRETFGMED